MKTYDYLWVDLQMSGLNEKYNRILQFACMVSDRKLDVVEAGPCFILHCDEEHLKTMDEWNMTHHTASGLYKACIDSKVTLKDVEEAVLAFLKAKGIMPGRLVIAGNSVHTDKKFIAAYMPNLDNFLHYRILDVTSVKIVVNVTSPQLSYGKKGNHRALDDIKESIGELKYYMKNAFK